MLQICVGFLEDQLVFMKHDDNSCPSSVALIMGEKMLFVVCIWLTFWINSLSSCCSPNLYRIVLDLLPCLFIRSSTPSTVTKLQKSPCLPSMVFPVPKRFTFKLFGNCILHCPPLVGFCPLWQYPFVLDYPFDSLIALEKWVSMNTPSFLQFILSHQHTHNFSLRYTTSQRVST